MTTRAATAAAVSSARSIKEELIDALQDDRVVEQLAAVFLVKLNSILDDKLDKLSVQINQNRIKSLQLEAELNAVKKRNETLNNECNVLKNRVADLDEYTRRDNVIINGLKLNYAAASSTDSSIACETAVLQLCADLGVPMGAGDISVAHGLGAARGSAGTSSMLVRFTSRKARDRLFEKRKELKTVAPRVYLNEHLTSDNMELFKTARRLVKEKKLASAWTNKGCVFVKISDLPTARPQKIKSMSELPV